MRVPHLTLEEIARQSGVSRSTVSRVINHQEAVSPQVRQRVWEVIKRTGYQPNLAARTLASQRSHVIGLVFPRAVGTFFTDPYLPRLTLGVAQACNQFDYTLSLFLFQAEDDERKLFPRLMRTGMVDGIIIQSTHAIEELYLQLNQSGIPYVIAGRPMSDGACSYVDVDNVSGAHNAVRHLIHQGRQRIATIAGPLSTSVGIDRLEGFRNALNESQLRRDDHLVAVGDFSESGGYYAAQRLLAYKPDAIFAASDLMALGALRAIREAGLEVPSDVALVGYDELPPATLATPQLTTIRQPIRRMGVRLVETLIDIIENGPLPPRRIILSTELVIRESCGAVRDLLQEYALDD